MRWSGNLFVIISKFLNREILKIYIILCCYNHELIVTIKYNGLNHHGLCHRSLYSCTGLKLLKVDAVCHILKFLLISTVVFVFSSGFWPTFPSINIYTNYSLTFMRFSSHNMKLLALREKVSVSECSFDRTERNKNKWHTAPTLVFLDQSRRMMII